MQVSHCQTMIYQQRCKQSHSIFNDMKFETVRDHNFQFWRSNAVSDRWIAKYLWYMKWTMRYFRRTGLAPTLPAGSPTLSAGCVCCLLCKYTGSCHLDPRSCRSWCHVYHNGSYFGHRSPCRVGRTPVPHHWTPRSIRTRGIKGETMSMSKLIAAIQSASGGNTMEP